MTNRPKRKTPRNWVKYSDEELLDLRFRELNVEIETSKLQPFIDRIYIELEGRDLNFRPHFWLGEEFFSPENVPGVALPFYLAHPRLERLEKKMMFEAEGSKSRDLVKILRHEVGHAVEHAYLLAKKKIRRQVFGSTRVPYPDVYTPKPFSRSFVINLDNWYAQSHPDEDFAETFAVWLKPGMRWKAKYRKWPAYKKLLAMEKLMGEVAGKKPFVRSKKRVDPIELSSKTLRQYYEEKQERYGLNSPIHFYDKDLKRLFSSEAEYQKDELASKFIRNHRVEIRKKVAFWTGQYRYTIDEVIDGIVERCDELGLRVMWEENQTTEGVMFLVTVQTMNYLHMGGYQLAL